MVLDAPDPTATRARGADWLELNAIAAARPGYGYAELIDALEIEDETANVIVEDESEQLEDEILQSKHDPFADDLLSELEWRALVLGGAYPFEIARVGPSWRLLFKPSREPGSRLASAVYTASLLVSGLRYGFIDDSIGSMFTPDVAEVFQILASLVARGILGGADTFWMGHPRPEHDGYGDALKRFLNDIGVGRIKSPYPPSQQGNNKDGGIDLIAWRKFNDRRPSPLVVYGQVASGKKWKDKSVELTLDSHFHFWMTDRPVKYYVPAMYIPFVQHEDVKARVGADFETVAQDSSTALEMRLGLVIDRVRLTELATTAAARGTDDDLMHFHRVLGWMARLIRALRKGSLPAASAAAA